MSGIGHLLFLNRWNAVCPLWVISGQTIQRRCRPLSAMPPIATKNGAAPRMTLSAKSRLMHRSKQHPHSIISSARSSKMQNPIFRQHLFGIYVHPLMCLRLVPKAPLTRPLWVRGRKRRTAKCLAVSSVQALTCGSKSRRQCCPPATHA